MNCNHARKLYAAFWDDETTQAEREWLEGHFASCTACRSEYEQYARTLELMGSLPRVEARADLHDRVLQRVRRAESAPDRMPAARPVWVPVASAAAAIVLFAVTLTGPWLAREPGIANRTPAPAVTQPVLVTPPPATPAAGVNGGSAAMLAAAATAATDSLFDHSEDVEFILDPVTLHRGRASVNRGTSAASGEKAVITF
jgi:anti-sigma factor RsiW